MNDCAWNIEECVYITLCVCVIWTDSFYVCVICMDPRARYWWLLPQHCIFFLFLFYHSEMSAEYEMVTCANTYLWEKFIPRLTITIMFRNIYNKSFVKRGWILAALLHVGQTSLCVRCASTCDQGFVMEVWQWGSHYLMVVCNQVLLSVSYEPCISYMTAVLCPIPKIASTTASIIVWRLSSVDCRWL